MLKEKTQFYVDYIGCEKRKLDAQKIIYYFKANDFIQSENISDADIILYITCAFIKEFEEISIDNIKLINKERKEQSKFIIGGCLPSINPLRLKNIENIGILPLRETERIDNIIKSQVKYQEIPDPNITQFENRFHNGKKINIHYSKYREEYEKAKRGYKIRLNYGCLGNCSYCVTRFATKELKSKPVNDVIKEFKGAISKNIDTIFFTGGDSGAYGLDINTNIVEILKKIFVINGEYKIYFQDFGIQWLIKFFDDLLLLFKKNKKNIGLLNFPIQSGSNRILKNMRRPYRIEDVIEELSYFNRLMPDIHLGTHLIVGFPGETKKDFKKTLNLLDKIRFSFIYIFKYSDNPLADSYDLKGKIDESIKEMRYKLLLEKYLKKINLN
ncbi:MAG: radical SAM protein [Candidatus Lokiarchaeota archaeon]|nr:radical SAM protein [Candidatus Lokiarchaeota archaeon]